MSEIITVIAVTPGMPCPEVHQFHPTHTPVPTTMRVGCKWPYLHPVFADFPSAKGSSFTQGYPMSTLDPSCPSAAQSMPDRHGAWRLAPYLKVGYASRSNLCSRAPRRSRPSWNLTKQIPLLPPRPLLNTFPLPPPHRSLTQESPSQALPLGSLICTIVLMKETDSEWLPDLPKTQG